VQQIKLTDAGNQPSQAQCWAYSDYVFTGKQNASAINMIGQHKDNTWWQYGRRTL
jgi:hypothetical protein